MTHRYRTDNLLIVRAVQIPDDQTPSTGFHYAYTFESPNAEQIGQRISDAAACVYDNHKVDGFNHASKAAREIRAARGLTE